MKLYRHLAKSVLVAAAIMMAVSCTNGTAGQAAGQAAASADTSTTGRMIIRYIDGDSLMANYNLAKEISEAMLRRSNQIDNEQQKRGAEITRFGNEIQNKYQNNGYLTQESFNADQAKLQQMQIDAQNYLAKLQRDGMKKLILDLRDNEGGVLPVATQMINEFLPADRMILYTEGQASPRKDFMSNGKGNFQNIPIDVLINEFSASASEIFAGAIQDNDRGKIIGRRSFGKGLVQEQRMLSDGSAIRLTVARYYTPSGRSIQKPYDHGNEDYYSDIYNRLLHGEFSEKDSISFDENLKYTTIGGRTVYGGGGIMPDIFVPADTTGNSRYLGEVSRTAYLYDYTFDFMDRHRQEMQDIKDYKELQAYLKQFDLVDEMADYAARRGLKRNEWGIRESGAIMRNRIEAYIARHLLDDDGFYPILGQMDTTLQEAVKQ